MASTEPSTPSTLSTSSISESTTTSSPEVPETTDRSDSEYYISCGSCKAVYLFPNYKAVEHAIGSRGTRVRCSVCDKQWFQSLDKAGKIDNMVSYDAITKERAVEMKKFITDNNWGRVPRGEKIDLFIGNIPFTYDEIDICELFSEYGVVGVTVVRDAEKQPKGFAFVELASRADADLAIKEMDNFYLDNSRRLVVKMSTRSIGGPAPVAAPAPPAAKKDDSAPSPYQPLTAPTPSVERKVWTRGGGVSTTTAPPPGGNKVWVPKSNIR